MQTMEHLQILIKPVSSDCNLRCAYCFYEDESRKRSCCSYGRMTEETAETVIQKALDSAKISCTFGFQGGEPVLAGLDFYKRFVKAVRERKKPNTKVFYTIQTNGTLVDGDWIPFLKKEKFLVGISLDGTKELHNRNRRDAGGRDSYETAKQNAQKLINSGVDVNVLCVLTRQTARHIAAVYQNLKKEGFRYQQYIPCLDPLGEKRGAQPWSLPPKDYGNALKTLFDLWVQDFERGEQIYVREFNQWLDVLGGGQPQACVWVGRCSMQNVVEANGDIFPCDFYALDDCMVGNVQDESFQFGAPSVTHTFFTRGRERGEDCPQCRWYPLCRGGCMRDYTEGEGGKQRNYYCESYRAFFPYAIERMEMLLRSGIRR